LREELADQSPVSNLFVQCQRIAASAQYLHETPDIHRSFSLQYLHSTDFIGLHSSHPPVPQPTPPATGAGGFAIAVPENGRS
jgi:hypothetical protein